MPRPSRGGLIPGMALPSLGEDDCLPAAPALADGGEMTYDSKGGRRAPPEVKAMSEDGKKAREHPQDEDLREVIRVWEQTEAEIIKGLLESQGIPCFFRGQILHSVYPIFIDGLGEIKILVQAKDLEIARELLESRDFSPENPT